jgi:hypothetical protein
MRYQPCVNRFFVVVKLVWRYSMRSSTYIAVFLRFFVDKRYFFAIFLRTYDEDVSLASYLRLFGLDRAGRQRSGTHPMYMPVYLPPDLLPSRSFVHEPEDLLVCPERASRLDAYKPPPTLPLMLIQYPFEEGLKSTAREGLYHPGRVLSYIFAVPVKRVRLAIR